MRACLLLLCFFLLAPSSLAAYPELTLRYNHRLFALNPNVHSEWRGVQEVWTHNGQAIAAAAQWRVDGDTLPPLPPGVVRSLQPGWDRRAIAHTLREQIASHLDRQPGQVAITRTATGAAFEGVGMLGLRLNIDDAVDLVIAALEKGINDIVLPVEEIQPQLFVNDPELQDRGIQEVVTVGHSNFAGSPLNRRHNIAVGLSKFNGHVIEQGATFSFNEILGEVDGSTGYKRELVILGDKTLPEYGGGLCQISTTAYRGAWEHGFPIANRRNHSFAVQYYGPQGTDATIYPPHTDMQFTNDGPSDLVIQTHVEGDDAYFIYYGTNDDRAAEVIGPYTWAHQDPPPDRTEYTTDIPPGTTRKVGSAVPGLRAAWFRIIDRPAEESEEFIEGYYSIYQARPLYMQYGIEAGEAERLVEEPEDPVWLVDTENDDLVPDSTESADVSRNRPTRRSIRNSVLP